MKKNIMFVMATIIVATFFLMKENREENISDITLANIEALAQSEGFIDDGTCYHSISTAAGSQVRYCGTCTFIPNSIGNWPYTGKCW